MSGLSRTVLDSAVSESQARDLSITSLTLYHQVFESHKHKLLCDAVWDTISFKKYLQKIMSRLKETV